MRFYNKLSEGHMFTPRLNAVHEDVGFFSTDGSLFLIPILELGSEHFTHSFVQDRQNNLHYSVHLLYALCLGL